MESNATTGDTCKSINRLDLNSATIHVQAIGELKTRIDGKLIEFGVHVAYSINKKLSFCTVYTPELKSG